MQDYCYSDSPVTMSQTPKPITKSALEAPREAAEASAEGFRRLVLRCLPRPVRDPLRTGLTRAAMVLSRADSRVGGTGLRLHLGCGTTIIEDWLNVDMLGNRQDLVWDLRVPLPFASGSASSIFHEHVIEHLSFPAAVRFLQDCRRLLEPGGVLRVGVPDFRMFAERYLTNDVEFLRSTLPERPTPLLTLNVLMYDFGHRAMWDEPTLAALLAECGFGDIRACKWGESALMPAPDSEHRRIDTLYIEAKG